MKTFRSICLALVALAIIKVSTRAASILDEITVAPVAALKSEGITGASTFGAGLDLGVGINKFVSIHAASLAYESDGWRSSTIDESEIYGRANFVKFASEKLVLYGKGGVVRDWNDEAWATSVGLGAELKLSKNIAVGADYSIRAWFSDRDKDSLARALVSVSF
jgi:hypothetical protein